MRDCRCTASLGSGALSCSGTALMISETRSKACAIGKERFLVFNLSRPVSHGQLNSNSLDRL